MKVEDLRLLVRDLKTENLSLFESLDKRIKNWKSTEGGFQLKRL